MMDGRDISLNPAIPALSSLERGWLGVYRGWYNVAIILVMITFVVGSTNYSFGLFVRPVTESLGLTRAAFNGGLSLFLVGLAVFSPVMGRLLDHIPALPVARACALLMLATTLAMSRARAPWLLLLLFVGPLALATVGCSGLFGTVIISRWFTDLRGRALSIMWMGTSFGGLVMLPINALLLKHLGWRTTMAAIGLMIALMVIGLSFLLKTHPDAHTQASLQARDPGQQAGYSWQHILARRDFWVIAVPTTLMLGVDQAILATTMPYALDQGMSLAQATSLSVALTASAIAGKVVIAGVADHADLRLLLAITAVFGVVHCLVLALTPGFAVLLSVSLMTGLAVGGRCLSRTSSCHIGLARRLLARPWACICP